MEKQNKRIYKEISGDGRGLGGRFRQCQFWSAATFCIRITQNYFFIKFRMIKKMLLVCKHAFNQNGLPYGALNT